jgi:hypothetical protein
MEQNAARTSAPYRVLWLSVLLALSPLIVAGLIKQFDSWTPVFVLGSVLCLAAVLLWFKIDPTKSAIKEHTPEVFHAHR